LKAIEFFCFTRNLNVTIESTKQCQKEKDSIVDIDSTEYCFKR